MKRLLVVAALTLALVAWMAPAQAAPRAAPIRPKLVIIAMFAPERQVWLDTLGPWRQILSHWATGWRDTQTASAAKRCACVGENKAECQRAMKTTVSGGVPPVRRHQTTR